MKITKQTVDESMKELDTLIAKSSHWNGVDADKFVAEVRGYMHDNTILERLTETYPNIATSPSVCGGLPVLSGTRFGVADVLSAICVYRGLGDAVENYRGRYTEDQFKDAVRFARDFMLESLSK